MESLLCDEVWLSSPATSNCFPHECRQCILESCACNSFHTSKEECEQASIIFLEKELTYVPQSGYAGYLQSHNLIHYRSRAVQWFMKSGSRLNLCFGTVFNAANYLDRFISMNQCHEWKYWMVELLSVACLSVASKFTETSSPSLHEIQIMEELDYSFQSSTIRRMELTLLRALGWRLNCITAHSYVELLLSNFDSLESHLRKELSTQFTKLLLESVLDVRLLEYRPSIVAVSALWCSLDELIPSSYAHLAYITRLFTENQQDDLVECHMIMKSRLVEPLFNLIVCGQAYNWPSSPVTVLLRERIDIYDSQVDLSIFNQMPGSNINLVSCEKRRKE